MAEANPSVLVMSYETAKFGSRWAHAPACQRKMLQYTVEVEEASPTYPYKRIVEQVVTRVEKVLCCPDCGEVLRNEYGGPLRSVTELGKRKQWCSHCQAALWQQIPFAYGGRVAIAGDPKDHAVADLIHKIKNKP